MNVRRSTVDCVEQLSRLFPAEVKAAGLDEPLRQIAKEHSVLNAREGHMPRRRTTSTGMVSATTSLAGGDDYSSELRDSARRALTYIEDRSY